MTGIILEDELYHRPTKCEKCGGRYIKHIRGIYKCEKCGNEAMDDYGKVRAFVEANPGTNVTEVVKGTGVSRNTVNQMIEDGKFDLI
ncbi:MAG: hypothetical protein MJZ11_05010 [Lachnospiraceae bacterium]|nr:hypothetical protein [Lachnospiraceae bacterium]